MKGENEREKEEINEERSSNNNKRELIAIQLDQLRKVDILSSIFDIRYEISPIPRVNSLRLGSSKSTPVYSFYLFYFILFYFILFYLFI